MKKLRYLIFTIFLIGSASSLLSQEYFFRSYSIEQGLPQSTIFCAMEDQRGEMWIGTEGSGICRFNGIDFQVIDKSDGLSGNIVRSVFEDSKGNIWIGTENSLDKYDGFTLHSFSDTKITETPVLAINEDKKGNIWVGTESKGLFRIEYGDSLIIENYTVSEGLANMFIFDIDVDNKDRVWLSLIGGINIVEYDQDDFKITKLIEGYDIPSGIILCGSMDPKGNMWFGTYQEGVFKVEPGDDLNNVRVYTPDFLDILSEERIWDIHWTANNECYVATEGNGVIHFNEQNLLDHYTKENGIKTNQIYRITESANGNMWFSTLGKGILKFENKLLVNYHSETGIKGNKIYDIERNEKGELLVGSDEGFSIYKFQGDQVEIIANYSITDGLPSNDITSINSKGDNIWLGSSNGIVQIVNGHVRIPEFNAGLNSQNVNCLLEDSKRNLWIGTNSGYSVYINNELHRINKEDQNLVNDEVQTIIEHSNGDIWMGTLGGLVRLHGTEYTDYIKEDGLIELSIHAITEDKNGDLWLGTFGGGIFLFSQEYDSIPIRLIAGNDILSSNNIYSLEFLNDSVLIAATESGFDQITIGRKNVVSRVVHYNVNDGYPGGGNNLNAISIDDNSLVWFGNSEGLVRFDPSQQTDLTPPEIQINRIKLFFEEQDWHTYGPTLAWFNVPKELMLPHKDNHLTIGFSSIFYGNHKGISYSYFLEGQSKGWSPYLQSMEVDFPGLRPGKYNFHVKAKNKFGITGEAKNFSFEIKPPFWQRPWFIILSVIALIAAVIVIIQLRTKKLKQEKIRLEKIVDERTREVVKQKDQIEKQHDIVVKQNIDIESSIHYAEKIQKAVIPSQAILSKIFNDSFILFRPQHIVSGDFYWIGQKGDYIIFTAVDCTGHGVPGAFMSMLGISYLNQIVLAENTVMPDQILNKLRTHVINSFSQKESKEDDRKDGMDIAMCSYNLKTKKLYYSGAYNPLFLIRSDSSEPEIIEHPADKMPVGLYAIMDDFKLNEIDYKTGDSIYMFSDGFPDQFGGERFKKFMKKRFKEMILNNQGKAMSEQKEVFNNILCEWMAFKDPDEEVIDQTDDILVMGIKL